MIDEDCYNMEVASYFYKDFSAVDFGIYNRLDGTANENASQLT